MDNNLYRFVKASERKPDNWEDVDVFRHNAGTKEYYLADPDYDYPEDGIKLDTHELPHTIIPYDEIEWLEPVAEDNQQELWEQVRDDIYKNRLSLKDISEKYHLIPKQVK